MDSFGDMTESLSGLEQGNCMVSIAAAVALGTDIDTLDNKVAAADSGGRDHSALVVHWKEALLARHAVAMAVVASSLGSSLDVSVPLLNDTQC